MLPSRSHRIAKTLSQSIKQTSRNYGAAATVPLTDPLEDAPSSHTPRKLLGNIKVTKLDNGIRVASCDKGGAVARIKISFVAGSRFEANSMQGIAHLVKNAAFISNDERTSLRTVRETQQTGGALQSTSSRELLSREAVFIRTKLAETMENIAPGITSPIFNPWDISEVRDFCKAEYAMLGTDNTAMNMDLLHKIAYRSGLGNSLYCNTLRIGSFSPDHLAEFVSNNYVGERLTIVGCDVDHDELLRYARDLFSQLPRGQAVNGSPQKYYGGEGHNHTANGLTYASLVSEGVGFFDKDLPALSVLQRVLGSGQYVKWGSNTVSSRLNKAAKAVTEGPLMIDAVNLSYSDSGLFGFHAIAEPQTITPVLKSAVSQMAAVAKGDITPEDIERAKNQSKSSLLMLAESQENNIDDITNQVAFSGSHLPHAESVNKIDQVTKEKVVQVAKKIYGGKPTLVVNGDTTCVPYVDELF